MRLALRPLGLPAFPQLATAYLLNELGDWLGTIALAVLVFDQTGSALATAALFLATQFLPALLAPALVARAEGLPSRRALQLLYAGEAVVFVALGILAGEFLLGAVLALAAADGVLASSARALTRATAAALLSPAALLREGNAILNVGFTAGAAVGPAVAGLVVAGAGVQAALFADAASFIVVAAIIRSAGRLPRLETEPATWRRRLANGLRYVRERPLLRRLLTAEATALVFFAAVIPVEVVFVKDTLGEDDWGYGLLLASWGTGMVAGSLLFAVLRRLSLWRLLAGSTLAIGIAYLGIGAAPSLAVASAASLVGGAGNGVQWVSLVSAVQEFTRAMFQARVISLLESLAGAMPGLGFVIGGAVAAVVNPRATFFLAGAGVLVVLAAAAAAVQRPAAGWKPGAVPAGDPLAAAPPAEPRHAAGTLSASDR